MQIADILKTYGKNKRRDIYEAIVNYGDNLFDRNWNFIKGISSKTTFKDNQYYVEIGTDCLTYNCDFNVLNRAGYVLAIDHMFHEYRHIQQFITERKVIHDTGITTASDRRMTDIIRRQFITSFYNSAYSHNYRNDPGEMDAEVYGIQKTIEYFKSDFIIPQKEAEDIIFQFMMSEDYGHKEELEQYDPKSIDDILTAFIDLRNKSVHILYPVTMEITSESELVGSPSDFDMTEEFLTLPKYKTHRKELEMCSDGRIEDKLLEQTIVQKYPDIVTTIPRLQRELTECQRALNSRIFVPKNHVIPMSQIHYTSPIKAESDDNVDFQLSEVIREFVEGLNIIEERNDEIKK